MRCLRPAQPRLRIFWILTLPAFYFITIPHSEIPLLDFLPAELCINFTYYDFRVLSSAQEYEDINWSSGTGDIGPTTFTINGKKYKLYLKSNDDGSIRISENQMIISEILEDNSKSFLKRIFNF